MKVSDPPPLQKVQINFDTSIDSPESYYLLGSCIQNINEILVNEHFENRYFPRFEWFKDHVRAESILNFGCSRRESLALMWHFGAKISIGIDKKPEKISDANRLVNLIKAVNNLHLPNLIYEIEKIIKITLPNLCSNGQISKAELDKLIIRYDQYLGELNIWTEKYLPADIRDLRLPKYHKVNISDVLELDDQFDLIYGRCVLYIAEEDGDDIYAAARNLASVLKPVSGRLVIVEPILYKGKTLDFVQPFLDVGMEQVMDTSNNELGGNEINNQEGDKTSELKGYIFRKPLI